MLMVTSKPGQHNTKSTQHAKHTAAVGQVCSFWWRGGGVGECRWCVKEGFGCGQTQRLHYPLIKEYTLNYNRNPNKI